MIIKLIKRKGNNYASNSYVTYSHRHSDNRKSLFLYCGQERAKKSTRIFVIQFKRIPRSGECAIRPQWLSASAMRKNGLINPNRPASRKAAESLDVSGRMLIFAAWIRNGKKNLEIFCLILPNILSRGIISNVVQRRWSLGVVLIYHSCCCSSPCHSRRSSLLYRW